jgi:GNAT superfamily N-acetyltransferase
MLPVVEIVEVSTPEHIEMVRSLFQAYQSELPAQYRFADWEWLNLPGEYAPPRGTLLLAMLAGHPAGCVGLRPFPLEGACEMKRLYVRPDFRGEKLGKRLVEEIIRAARRLGYARLRLDTHPDSMRSAIELYRRFRFVEAGEETVPHVAGLSYMELVL